MEVMGQIYCWYFQRIVTCFLQAETTDKDTAVCFELIIPQRNADSRLALGWEASQEHLWLQSDNHIPMSLLPAGCSPVSVASQRRKSSKCRGTKASPHLPFRSFPSIRQRMEKQHSRGYGKQFWGGCSLKGL